MVEVNKSEDLWSSYKALKQIVWKHLNEDVDASSMPEFESTLRKHKQNFFALLQNQPKNPKSRDELKKGMVDGITIKGLGHQILSRELYQEAIILSDMFDMNEFIALDLLCTAQIQMSRYPGLPRGLVAVLLYYDGRKCLVSTLRYLVQARSGVQWSLNINAEVEKFITTYTDQLMDGGLFNRIFELLATLDLSKEIERLQENLALGGPKHRRQVTDLFQDIRTILADTVFTWSVQSGLPRAPTVSLINYLRGAVLEEEASGTLDNVNLYLLLALLSALDLSVLHSREDGEDAVQSLPILSDPGYIDAIINEFTATKPKWKCEGLQATATFGLAVCIASLHLIPQQNPQQFQDAVNKEEVFIDEAIEMNVFEFMNNIVFENDLLYKEAFLYKRMHHLITDFIVYMYPKVKELRIKADEIARTVQIYAREGLEAPANLPRYFEYLMLSIAKFYANDKLATDYVLNYWSPVDIGSVNHHHNVTGSYRASPRAVSLFKFLRLAGDMVPSTLFVPYLTMLSSLASCQQAARYCFNMLKQVGGVQLTSTLSWDHFFQSFAQYYSNLRQETLPVTDTVYRTTFYKGVSPQELEGLHAVLLLIRTVAENDEFSRLALCEHPGWAPLSILLGLVGCSVPIPLKADLLLTLAALAKTTENAAQMWENLEASQILLTIPTTSNYAPRGIQTELDEIESRLEEYPLTRALLKLLDTLTDFGIPRTLGAGPRKPGFDPYLSFIINSVFLKFHMRSYKNPTEKWEVAYLCLKLFEKFLNQYDPQLSDFPGGLTKLPLNDFNSPPGYHLMIQLNNKSELLNVVLDIISEGNRLFDSYVHFQGQRLVEDCTLSCLNIIQAVLALHGKFLNALTASSSSILLINITGLLLTINRNTGKPDHCINIAKYISFDQPLLLKHSLVAVKILNHITSSPILHGQFVTILLASDAKDDIKNGFVQNLDAMVEEEDVELIMKTKLEILKLLKQSLSYNAPNLSHLLLGFDIKRDISRTEFQYPGVLDFPRACLHSIISILDLGVARDNVKTTPLLLESAYHMIYLLASNGRTYGPVLRFLRLNKLFYINHLKICYKKLSGNGNLVVGGTLNIINQMSWLLKTLAIEIKVSSQNKQVSYLKQLTNFLVNLPRVDDDLNQDLFAPINNTTIINDSNDLTSKSHKYFEMINSNFMIQLTEYFELSQNNDSAISSPTWQFFDNKVLANRLKSCENESTAGRLIDLKKLHQILYDELKSLQGTAVMGQIQAVTQEIPKVLKYALELNRRRENYTSVVHFVDAWRQLTEVLMIFIPSEVLSAKEAQMAGICFVSNLLKKIVKIDLLPEVAQFLSGAVLLIFENLRKNHNWEKQQKKVGLVGDTNRTTSTTVLEIHLGSLKEVLGNLIDWIITSNVTDEKLRINLYASLDTLLEITNVERQKYDLKIDNSSYLSRLDSSRINFENYGNQLSMDALTKFGDKLIEVMCQDCIGGYEVSNMLALSSFSLLITLSGNVNWILYLSGRGYLKYIIQSLQDSDKDLQLLLEPVQSSIKPLYVYMAKLLFLNRLAGNRVGAELLLEQKLFSCLSNMKVFSFHPEISRQWKDEDILENFIPSTEEQYLQLWMPTLEICNAILTTLGGDNQSAVTQITYFILNHLDVVLLILRSASPTLSLASLKELSLLTSVIARTATSDLLNILETGDGGPENVNRSQLFRLQKVTLSLLPKFILSERTVKDLICSDNSNTFQTSERLLSAMQIMSNLLCYSRCLVASHSVEHNGVGVIFQPTLDDPTMIRSDNINVVSNKSNNRSTNLSMSGLGGESSTPSLGVIVQQLISTVGHHRREKFTFDLLERKVKEVSQMDGAELEEFLVDAVALHDINAKREFVFKLMSDRLDKKRREMEYSVFIIENAIYLIWVHLDYYMLKSIPRIKKFGSTVMDSPLSKFDNNLASATEATWRVSTDDISSLKHGLIAIFNDSFSKNLSESVQDCLELDRQFVETLFKKIVRLLQFVPVK